MQSSIDRMLERLQTVLPGKVDSAYLYGSAVLNDFRLGWSDLDFLCLTKEPLTDEEAETLLFLRQTLLSEEPGNLYYRSFEGPILSLDEYRTGNGEKAVVWRTGGQRIAERYESDVFSRFVWIRYGRCLWGTDRRNRFSLPSRRELVGSVRRHYETIRKYAAVTGESLYSCGWLLDIARGLYTLRYSDVIAKTRAGEWALREGLCPVEDDLRQALTIRREPLRYRDQPQIRRWLASLGPSVQRFADVLEEELNRGTGGSAV